MCNQSRRAAFTLIEILVVIAIIALLAAILFPVFSRAREKARSATCMSNERQIAMALLQYSQDNNRRFPPLNDPSQDGWSFALGISDEAIFQCPSQGQDSTQGYTDYWMNSQLLGLHDVRVRYPSNTILIGDGDTYGSGYNMGPPGSPTGVGIQIWSASADYASRHFDGANYAFADGHAKWLRPEMIDTTDAASSTNFAFDVK